MEEIKYLHISFKIKVICEIENCRLVEFSSFSFIQFFQHRFQNLYFNHQDDEEKPSAAEREEDDDVIITTNQW